MSRTRDAREHAVFLQETALLRNLPPRAWFEVAEAWLVASDAAEERGNGWLARDARYKAIDAYRRATRDPPLDVLSIVRRERGAREPDYTLMEAARVAAERWLTQEDFHALNHDAADDLRALMIVTRWRPAASTRARGLSPILAFHQALAAMARRRGFRGRTAPG